MAVFIELHSGHYYDDDSTCILKLGGFLRDGMLCMVPLQRILFYQVTLSHGYYMDLWKYAACIALAYRAKPQEIQHRTMVNQECLTKRGLQILL
jgi:hypothetical protein